MSDGDYRNFIEEVWLDSIKSQKPNKKETRMKKTTYKLTRKFSTDRIIDEMPTCTKALEYLKLWKNCTDAEIWFQHHSEAAEWLVDNGFATVEKTHDWSGLELKEDSLGKLCLYDSNTGRYLFGFHSDGTVLHFCAAGTPESAGNFDSSARLILTEG